MPVRILVRRCARGGEPRSARRLLREGRYLRALRARQLKMGAVAPIGARRMGELRPLVIVMACAICLWACSTSDQHGIDAARTHGTGGNADGDGGARSDSNEASHADDRRD